MDTVNNEIYSQYLPPLTVQRIAANSSIAISGLLDRWNGRISDDVDVKSFPLYFEGARKWFDESRTYQLTLHCWIPLLSLTEMVCQCPVSSVVMDWSYFQQTFILNIPSIATEPTDHSPCGHPVLSRPIRRFTAKIQGISPFADAQQFDAMSCGERTVWRPMADSSGIVHGVTMQIGISQS